MPQGSREARHAGAPNTDGKKILLVEDYFLVAEAYRSIIEGFGFEVMGPAATVRTALELLETEIPDGALLDVAISGSTVTPVAERLLELDRPFVFLTAASDLSLLPEHLRHAEILGKPPTAAGIRKALDTMLDGR